MIILTVRLNLDKVRRFAYALGMTENLTVTSERVDDIPLLLAHMQRMDLPMLLSCYFPSHGNRQGLSFGWTVTIWLADILSQADHRMNQVQPWAECHLETLRAGSGQDVQVLDLTDDRLAALLRTLSDDTCWANFERSLSGSLLRDYDLRPNRVRLDSTTASGYWEATEDGLFPFGHSKDHRPDLPQVKVMLATLDPLGLPLATDVLADARADAPLYLPAIARVRASLQQRGLLYTSATVKWRRWRRVGACMPVVTFTCARCPQCRCRQRCWTSTCVMPAPVARPRQWSAPAPMARWSGSPWGTNAACS
jgi:hypothetical protein